MLLKDKREGRERAFKAFVGSDGTRHVSFRSTEGSFYVFAEVEGMQAARECGASALANARQMWESLREEQALRRPPRWASAGSATFRARRSHHRPGVV